MSVLTRAQAEEAAVISLEEVLIGLSGLEILTDEEIQRLRASAVPDADTEAVSSLVSELVDRKKLTPYQSRQFLQGRWRQLCLGDYLLLEKIGQGGMGQVFLALHRHMQRRVALKLLPENMAAAEGAASRFQREMRIIAKVSHPNIVAAYDAGEDQGMFYLVMEYVEGETLHELVKRRGPLPVAEALGCVVQAARGLKAAHASGIVHRDVKPSNLLRDRNGTIKILDLGLARLVRPSPEVFPDRAPDTLTGSDQILGTIDYMAPEQAVAGGKVDQRADIYSLGCCLYYLLTGRPVYQRTTPVDGLLAHREASIPSLPEARSDIPPELDTAFRRMIAKDPDDRFASAQEVIEALDLRRYQDNGVHGDESDSVIAPFVASVAVPPARRRVTGNRRKWLAIGAAVVALVGIAASVPWIVRGLRAPDRRSDPVAAAPKPVVMRPAATLRGHENTVECLAFLQGTNDLVSGDDDQAILVWDLEARRLRFPLAKGGQTGPCLAADPSGKLLATASGDGVLKLWDLTSRKDIARLAGQRVAFSPAGRLMGAGRENYVSLYDTTTGKSAGELLGHDSFVQALAFAPDGKTLVSGDEDGILQVWNVDDQSNRWELENTSKILTIAVAAGGALAAVGSDDGAIRLWNIRHGRLEATLAAHRGTVSCVAFSPDGARLASVGGDGAVALWEVASLRGLSTWQATNRGQVYTVAFSPDGTRLATGGDDLAVKLWDLNAAPESQPATER